MASGTDQPQQSQSLPDYIIWPYKPITAEEQKKTEDAIRSVIGSINPIRNYTSTLDGLTFWLCQLTAEQVEEVKKLDWVKQVQEDILDPNTQNG